MPDPAHILEAGAARLVVDAVDGGRITSLAIDGVEIVGGVGPGVVDHGSFAMVPGPGGSATAG